MIASSRGTCKSPEISDVVCFTAPGKMQGQATLPAGLKGGELGGEREKNRVWCSRAVQAFGSQGLIKMN